MQNWRQLVFAEKYEVSYFLPFRENFFLSFPEPDFVCVRENTWCHDNGSDVKNSNDRMTSRGSLRHEVLNYQVLNYRQG